jgi:hypothetical protein
VQADPQAVVARDAPPARASVAGPFAVPSIDAQAVASALGYTSAGLPTDDGLPGASGPIEMFPIGQHRRQEMQRAMQAAGSRPMEAAAPQIDESVRHAPANQPPRRTASARIVDPVEGTSKDPLLNRTFDLNSAKTVPSFR